MQRQLFIEQKYSEANKRAKNIVEIWVFLPLDEVLNVNLSDMLLQP